MSWIILLLAGFFEIAWATGLKYSNGFTKLLPSVFTAVTMTVSVILLSWSMKTLPMGTAYVVWTGIGSVGAVVLGILIFNEPAAFSRILCLLLIIAGIVGLKILS